MAYPGSRDAVRVLELRDELDAANARAAKAEAAIARVRSLDPIEVALGGQQYVLWVLDHELDVPSDGTEDG